jgi:hypothetical protein
MASSFSILTARSFVVSGVSTVFFSRIDKLIFKGKPEKILDFTA